MQSAQLPVKVNLRDFKEFVAKNFDETTPLYKVLMPEKDEVSREEFAAKFAVETTGLRQRCLASSRTLRREYSLESGFLE